MEAITRTAITHIEQGMRGGKRTAITYAMQRKDKYLRDEVMLNVLRCQLTYYGQAETNAEAWFKALRPRKPEAVSYTHLTLPTNHRV